MISNKIIPIKEWTEEQKKQAFKDLGFTPKNEYIVILGNFSLMSIEKGKNYELREMEGMILKAVDIAKLGNYTIALMFEVGVINNEV